MWKTHLYYRLEVCLEVCAVKIMYLISTPDPQGALTQFAYFWN